MGALSDFVATPEAPGLTLISTQTISSPVAAVDFTGIDDTYDKYIISVVDAILVVDGTNLEIRCSVDDGSTFAAGASDYVRQYVFSDTSSTGIRTSQGASDRFIVSIAVGNDASTERGASGLIYLSNPASGAYLKIRSDFSSVQSLDSWFTRTHGFYKATSPVNAIRFIGSLDNISSGTFSLYGVKK